MKCIKYKIRNVIKKNERIWNGFSGYLIADFTVTAFNLALFSWYFDLLLKNSIILLPQAE